MPARPPATCLGIALSLVLAALATAQEKPAPTPVPAEAKVADADRTAKPDAKSDKPDAKSDKPAASEAKPEKAAATGPRIEKVTLGLGCFWSAEAMFERVPGVLDVVPGYAGGTVAFPSYDLVCTGETGHAEVVQITYDASVLPFDKLLQIYWRVHDPTTPNAQGDDFGTNYRSIILYHSEAQRDAALKSYKELTARRAFRSAIVTQLAPMTAFYPAEPYHQNYYRNHPDSPYSQSHIEIKLMHLRKILAPASGRTKAAASRAKAAPKPQAKAPTVPEAPR